jgi:hypothetical protein
VASDGAEVFRAWCGGLRERDGREQREKEGQARG